MENLIVIKESLAMRIMDAGLDCVQVKYAVPAKIAALFEIKAAEKKPNPKRKYKPQRNRNVYQFTLSLEARKNLARMTPGSLNQKAASILCLNLSSGEEINKKRVLEIWKAAGFTQNFLKYGTGQMLKAGILNEKEDDL
jgi:hypothetical protein